MMNLSVKKIFKSILVACGSASSHIAQASKPAVSQVSKPAGRLFALPPSSHPKRVLGASHFQPAFSGQIVAVISLLMVLTITSSAQTAMNAANLPLWFEAGHGQSGITAPFAAHGPDSAFFMTESNAQFVLRKASGETAATCMQFVGANPAARIAGESAMPGKVNYLIGNDPAKWRSGVPAFGRVRVDNVYPGINVVYYGNGRQLEYDFDLAAGVDPRTIVLRFDGADKISVNPQGELVVSLHGGEVIQRRPVIYQDAGLARHEISGGYQMLDAHTVTFALSDYNHALPLVIDPVLGYSTYFGGNNNTYIHAVALGQGGSVYVAGETISTVFTNIVPGYRTNFAGGTISGDVFVAKFDSFGNNAYFTYLGGSVDEVAFGLAVDSAGEAFVTGYTDSPDFPITTSSALQPQIAGKINTQAHVYPSDAFLAKLSASGSNLLYSTFIGGNEPDIATAVTVDANTNAFVVGYTYSTNFLQLPKTNGFSPYQATLQCSNTLYFNANAFLVEISAAGALKYASFFGGTNYDAATSVTLDNSNYIYVAGYTASTNFPTINSLSGNKYLNGSTNSLGTYDAFVAKFTPGFTHLVYSTFLGGSNIDWGSGIAADSSGFGNAYVVGATTSLNFPSNQPAGAAGLTSCVLTNTAGLVAATNAFLTKIGWDSVAQRATNIYSVVFGGAGYDIANGVAVDTNTGNVFVVGSAASTNFPVTTNNLYGSLQTTNSSQLYLSDVFITALSSSGVLLYSAYLGGNGDEIGAAITVDSIGTVYVAGTTTSTNYPTFNAWQNNASGAWNGESEGFISKILLTPPPLKINATKSGTNLYVKWQSETLLQYELASTTNLLNSGGWSLIDTNPPTFTNGVYEYTLPHTNSLQFFRVLQY